MLYDAIKKLVQYGINTGITPESERIYTTNLLLDLFHEDNYEDIDCDLNNLVLEDILAELLDIAAERGIIENSIGYRDLFDTKLMNTLMPRPAQIQQIFWEKYKVSPETATDYYYKLSQDSDYIRRYRVKKDQKWTVDSPYGAIDITINLSKPEKDPRDIAAAKLQKKSAYPQCQLCVENMGFAGHQTHPARQNLRPVKLNINSQDWFMQYSPYGYYNEHCIVFNQQHIPMTINAQVFNKLFDFVEQFPHYFIGSNADLPIVGGSILTHEHFQGGNYNFAMAKAPIERTFLLKNYMNVSAGIVKWPMSVIRLSSKNRTALESACADILSKWRTYTDEVVGIFAETDGILHNTITPIARATSSGFECDLVLRNNITTKERPLGVFHPNPTLHHIKKENIGLIEVMGLAVLPARLADELTLLKDAMLSGKEIATDDKIASHAIWASEILKKYSDFNADNAMDIIRYEVGRVFEQVLEDAGVFKRDKQGKEAFARFVEQLG